MQQLMIMQLKQSPIVLKHFGVKQKFGESHADLFNVIACLQIYVHF